MSTPHRLDQVLAVKQTLDTHRDTWLDTRKMEAIEDIRNRMDIYRLPNETQILIEQMIKTRHFDGHMCQSDARVARLCNDEHFWRLACEYNADIISWRETFMNAFG